MRFIMPMFDPPHPGEFIRDELLVPLGLTVTAAAEVLRVSRPTLSSLLNKSSDLSLEMALRIEKGFGLQIDILLGMQSAYDIFQARKRASKIKVKRYVPKHGRALAMA